MTAEKVFLNGSFVSGDKAKISIYDRGFLYGEGLFETVRVYTGVPFRLNEHLDRLFRSAKEIGIVPPYTPEEFEHIIKRLITVNKLSSAYVRVTVSKGVSGSGLLVKDRCSPTVVIVAKDFTPPSSQDYRKGWRAVIVSHVRQNQASPLSGLKSLNYLNHILARREAEEKGVEEGILLNTLGEVTEASRSNVFLVKKGVLITPAEESGLLPGITRMVVVKLVSSLGLEVYEKKVFSEDLLNADEIFLTNSLIEVMPLVEVDRYSIGEGKPGPITKRIHKAYRELVRKETGIAHRKPIYHVYR